MDGIQFITAPVSSPPETRRLEKNLSLARSRHDSTRSSESATENIDELEMLLEAYFIVTDSTFNKLTSLKEYIYDTEDFIDIQLDNVRNQLLQFELILTTATFVVAIFGVVAEIFGMNFEISLFDYPSAFKWALVIPVFVEPFCSVHFCVFQVQKTQAIVDDQRKHDRYTSRDFTLRILFLMDGSLGSSSLF